MLTGFLICGHRWSQAPRSDTDAWHQWNRRVDLLIPPGTEKATFSTPRLFAATYPEAVKLAALIGSLHWRRLAAGDPNAQRRFAIEIGRRLGEPDYRPRATGDPIAHWMDEDCWRPPSLPAKNYRTSRDYGGSPPRKIRAASESRHLSSALWFSRGRPAGKHGRTIIGHRHLTPVLIRDWAPQMEFYVGAVSVSTSTKQLSQMTTRAHRTKETTGLLDAEYVRPEPAPGDYLNQATTPQPWHLTTRPRPWQPRPLDGRRR